MSADSSLLTIDTTALQSTVAEMCAGHGRLEEFLRGMFGDLNSLADEIARHGQWIDSTKCEQKAQQSAHEELLGRERDALETTFERIRQLTDRLEVSAVAGTGGTEHFQKLLENMAEERETWRASQPSSGPTSADLTRMADDLAATRQELAEARDELRSQREVLSQISFTHDPASDSDIRDRLDRIEQERLNWAQERAALETELDSVRNRAAELADTLDDERQRASGERKDWAEELRQMRQLLQSLSERASSPAPAAAMPISVASEPAEQEDAQDPVLDSVMAQFEILQKDLARRRKAKPVLR